MVGSNGDEKKNHNKNVMTARAVNHYWYMYASVKVHAIRPSPDSVRNIGEPSDQLKDARSTRQDKVTGLVGDWRMISHESSRFQVVPEYGITNCIWVMSRYRVHCKVRKPTISDDTACGLDILIAIYKQGWQPNECQSGEHTTTFVKWV